MYVNLMGTTMAAAMIASIATVSASTTCFSTMGSLSVDSVPTHFETIFLTATKTEWKEVQPTTIVQVKANKVEASYTTTTTLTHTVTVKSTSTKTIPTPSGFVPVSSSLPLSPKKVNARDTIGESSHLLGALGKPAYPQSVGCKVFERTTSTVTSIAALAAQTSFVNAGNRAATTTTRTVTVTKTHTDVVPGPTIYNACLSKNQESYPGTDYVFITPDDTSDYSVETNDINTVYDCCVACITQFNCTVGMFGGPDSWYGKCFFFANFNSGPQSNSTHIAYYTDSYYANGYKGPVFNGQCGKLTEADYEAID